MLVVFDTNILIDYLLGIEQAKTELRQYQHPQISIITWIEVLIGSTEADIDIIKGFLRNFVVIDLTSEIGEIAANIRKQYKIKLPDAIIWATARHTNSLLVTRNSKDFTVQAADVKVPYQL